MVTKLVFGLLNSGLCYILAKNHMVTKHISDHALENFRYILAKNHMVTKHQIS